VAGAGRGQVREVPSIGCMSFSWEDSCTAFADAAGWFVGTAALAGDRWDRPGLGEWDVRALAGHTSRALVTVETYFAHPAAAADIASPAGYFRATRAAAATAAVAARGREAGAALGNDSAAAVAQIAARVLALVDTQDGTELVTTIAGGMRLSDYLPTRTFELAVHTADLATVLGVPPDVPATAAAQALAIVTDLAVADGLAGPSVLMPVKHWPRAYAVSRPVCAAGRRRAARRCRSASSR
jgi:Mycothiol maleylpyruvate isomerase N-terminal domain